MQGKDIQQSPHVHPCDAPGMQHCLFMGASMQQVPRARHDQLQAAAGAVRRAAARGHRASGAAAARAGTERDANGALGSPVPRTEASYIQRLPGALLLHMVPGQRCFVITSRQELMAATKPCVSDWLRAQSFCQAASAATRGCCCRPAWRRRLGWCRFPSPGSISQSPTTSAEPCWWVAKAAFGTKYMCSLGMHHDVLLSSGLICMPFITHSCHG
jgi:hypothetical protein